MKLCCTCKQEKSVDQFNKKASSKDGLERYCKQCHCERNRSHYKSNSAVYKEQAIKYRTEFNEWYQTYKSNLKCVRCSETKPWRLAFHHTDPTAKEYGVSHMVNQLMSKAAIMAEIEKCDVVCHNCHADIHHELKQ